MRPERAVAAPSRVRSATPPAQTGPLSATQKRYLRGFTHALKAVILVGQNGVTPALLNELDAALSHHELVKVKLDDGHRDVRAASIELIRTSSHAELVQAIGRVACFYRCNAEQSNFDLPK